MPDRRYGEFWRGRCASGLAEAAGEVAADLASLSGSSAFLRDAHASLYEVWVQEDGLDGYTEDGLAVLERRLVAAAVAVRAARS